MLRISFRDNKLNFTELASSLSHEIIVFHYSKFLRDINKRSSTRSRIDHVERNMTRRYSTCIISTMCNDVKFGERVRRPRSIFQELGEGSSRSWRAAAFANFPIHAPPYLAQQCCTARIDKGRSPSFVDDDPR